MDSRGGKKSWFRGLGVKVQRVFNYSAIYHIYQKKKKKSLNYDKMLKGFDILLSSFPIL